MIRMMLFAAAGSVALACSACAPPVPTPIVGLSSGIGTGNPNCTATDFANSVQVLGAAFDPTSLKPPPTGASLLKDTNTGAWQDLSDAFDAAPTKFKQRLCMTSVFIDPYYDPNNPLAWGFRNPNQTTQRFIGLPGSFWGGGNLTSHVISYSDYETQLFSQLFKRSIGRPWDTNSAYPPTYGQASSSITSGAIVSVDMPGTTILAVLAHEYGHTLFYELFKGPNDDATSTAMNAWAFCRTTNGYFDKTWATITVPPNYWTDFGAVTDSHADNLVQISDIQNEFRSANPNWKNIATYVAALYANDNYPPPAGRARSGFWPSFFGAISPIEDFVEAFKFAVLRHPGANKGKPITSMPIYITSAFTAGTAFDVFADEKNGNKQGLHSKRLCIHNLILQ